MVSWDLPPPAPPAPVGRPGGAPRSALVLAGLAVPRQALLQQPSPCPALPSGGESSGQRGVSSRAGTRGALRVPTAAGLPSPAPHGSNLSPVLSLPKSKQRSCASPQGPSRCCFAPLVAQALSPSPAAPRGRPARPCHLPPHAASGKHDGSVIKPASLSRSRVVERQRRASQPGALLVRRPERAACRASPAPRAGLGRCFNGRVWRGAWAARGRALPPARRWGHGACLSPRARPRGAGPGSQDRVSAPLPHGTVLGKELALACWAGAKAGNYNLLAQIPPAVSEVRSSWLAPSALVPLLRSRDCIWVLNEATRPRQAVATAGPGSRALVPGGLGRKQEELGGMERAPARARGHVGQWQPSWGSHGVRLKATPSSCPLVLRGCPPRAEEGEVGGGFSGEGKEPK